MTPALPQISGAVYDRASCHLESGLFNRVDPRFHKKLAELLATLQLNDEAKTKAEKDS